MDELDTYIIKQNPHWTKTKTGTGVKREQYLKKIAGYLTNTQEILIISGVRRAGKTTLLHQTIEMLLDEKMTVPEHILFLSCDGAELSNLTHPLETVIDRYKKITGGTRDIWLFLDEIQSIPDFERTLKILYDSKEYHIIISGSTSHILQSKSGTYLSGRYISLQVYPLSFSEYLLFKNIQPPKTKIQEVTGKYELLHALSAYLEDGGFPAVVSIENASIKADLIKAYYESIVYRDVISSHKVKNPGVMAGLLSYLITNISSPLSYRKLAGLFKSEPLTIQDYMSYAVDGNLLYVMQKFSFSYKKQLVSQKKVYVVDTSLRSAAAFVFSSDTGHLAENAVCIELLRRGFSPMYFNEDSEIDFVVQNDDGVIELIQVCYADEVPKREFKGFEVFKQLYPQANVKCLVLTQDYEEESDGVCCIPLWKWLTA